MNVYYCKKCNRAAAGNNLSKCSKCGNRYISLGIDSSKWSSLSNDQKSKLLSKYVSGKPQASKAETTSAPSSEVSEIWFWLLGFSPFISHVIFPFTGFDILGRGGSNKLFVILSIVFWILDYCALNKSGYDKGGWRYIGIVLPPVYLFIRASHTNRNWIPGMIWCASLVVIMFIILRI